LEGSLSVDEVKLIVAIKVVLVFTVSELHPLQELIGDFWFPAAAASVGKPRVNRFGSDFFSEKDAR
jgi:hypothetical protein